MSTTTISTTTYATVDYAIAEEIALAPWAEKTRRSALQEMLAIAARPGLLSFALGLPAPELFPKREVARAAAHVLGYEAHALQYHPPLRSLKERVVELMLRRGVECTPEQVFLTAGAQQGMNLLARLLLDSSSEVLLEEVAYPGFRQVIEPYQPERLTVPTDLSTGMDVDEVESFLEAGARPALIYAVPEGHNPLGVSMSLEKRERLVSLSRRFGVPIVEDDAYGFLSYDGEALPPLRALDEQVLYVGSFSKILAPALRAGWLVVPESLIPKLSIVKEASDIDTTTFSQRVIDAYLEAGHLPAHLARLRREYGARRDAMLRALEEYFPADCRWAKPSSGVFIWVELPETVDTYELLKTAVETEQVAFIPGSAFYGGPSVCAPRAMRLNFSNCTPERIREGVARLARVLRDARA
jgi:2-aminoadipate transaminase